MRILFVTSNICWPPRVGGEIRKWNMLQGLLAAGETDAVVFCRNGSLQATESFTGCRQVIPVDDRHIHMSDRQRARFGSTLGRGLLTLGQSLPYEYLGEDQAQLHKQLRHEIDFGAYDLLWFATARAAVPVGRIAKTPTILDGDDYSYVREWHLLKNSGFYGAKLWNYIDLLKLWWWETGFPRHYSRVVRCSTEDVQRHPRPNVICIPNGTQVPPELPRTPQRRLLFVGDLSYVPNEQGLQWFLLKVWPGIRAAVGDAGFDIVGRQPPDSIRHFHGQQGINVHGFVDDLSALFRRAACSVVPLHAGGGTRLKILESLAMGVPVVSTTLGAFGIDATSAHGVQRSDSPESFAHSCIELMRNPESGIAPASAGRKLIEARYDWRVIRQQVTELARNIAATT